MCTIIGYKSLKISENTIHKALESTYSRGPDDERIQQVGCGYLGFQRLSIMGLSPEGMQPFVRNNNLVVCNGEIYGFRKLKEELEKMATHLFRKVIVKFFYHSMKNMV